MRHPYPTAGALQIPLKRMADAHRRPIPQAARIDGRTLISDLPT